VPIEGVQPVAPVSSRGPRETIFVSWGGRPASTRERSPGQSAVPILSAFIAERVGDHQGRHFAAPRLLVPLVPLSLGPCFCQHFPLLARLTLRVRPPCLLKGGFLFVFIQLYTFVLVKNAWLPALFFPIARRNPGRPSPTWQRLPARPLQPARAPSFRPCWRRKAGIVLWSPPYDGLVFQFVH